MTILLQPMILPPYQLMVSTTTASAASPSGRGGARYLYASDLLAYDPNVRADKLGSVAVSIGQMERALRDRPPEGEMPTFR